jgi:hypothetical protein
MRPHRLLVTLALSGSLLFGQAPTRSKALQKCEAERDLANSTTLSDATTIDKVRSDQKALTEEKAKLTKQYEQSLALLSMLRTELSGNQLTLDQQKQLAEIPSGAALDNAVSVESLFQSLAKHDSSTVDKYNELLANYQNYVRASDAAIARLSTGVYQQQQQQQQRVNNALTLYSLMPKYTPPQTIQLQTYDCTKYPAACVH